MEEKQQARLKYYIRWYFVLGKSVGKIGLSQLLEWHLMEYGMHVQKIVEEYIDEVIISLIWIMNICTP